MHRIVFAITLALALPATAAELKFDFGNLPEGQTPADFRATVYGQGKAGEWKVVMDEVPSALAPLSPQAANVSKIAVLAQTSQDPTDEHFPMLIYEKEKFKDFKLTTRFKNVSGEVEQIAGIAFRIQDEQNFYVVRASSKGSTFRFYKVVNGERSRPIGQALPIVSNVWHDLTVECKGTQISFLLDGKEVIPPLNDQSFGSGKIGFWTKSDSVSYFVGTKITYESREPPAQRIVRDVLKKYSKLEGLKIYVADKSPEGTKIVASKDVTDLGKPGGKSEREVMKQGVIYYGKEDKVVNVITPLRDRNGEPVAVARIVMKSLSGQTEQNAITRAMPITKAIQSHILSMDDLVD